jgi:hypothetical protein
MRRAGDDDAGKASHRCAIAGKAAASIWYRVPGIDEIPLSLCQRSDTPLAIRDKAPRSFDGAPRW